jgi:hypothetical protein
LPLLSEIRKASFALRPSLAVRASARAFGARLSPLGRASDSRSRLTPSVAVSVSSSTVFAWNGTLASTCEAAFCLPYCFMYRPKPEGIAITSGPVRMSPSSAARNLA